MLHRRDFLRGGLALAWLAIVGAAWGEEFASHPPMRPLPEPSGRALPDGPAYFVDAQRGDDARSGSQAEPWRSVNHAVKQLEPGDTLVLRGGTYYENVVISVAGDAERPITVRSHPGELAIIDAGFREFYERPHTAWEPDAHGAVHAYVSTGTYPSLGNPGLGRRNVGATGNFGDSMVPLHPYGGWVVQDVNVNLDFRSDPAANHDAGPKNKEIGIYNGPGVWFNPETDRIHVRLEHTQFRGLDENYRGETDPRRLPLVIAGPDSALVVNGARHVRVQDLVLRGSRSAAISVSDAHDVEFDGIAAYGGSPVFSVLGTDTLRMVNSGLRGVSAPWSNRASEKYRGLSSYLFVAGRGNRNFELAYCEFTDCHDGMVIGCIDTLRFHHNLVDNFNDDGLYLTTGYPAGRELSIYQNRISRCLGSLSFAGRGTDQDETTVAFIHRNVFDLREPIHRGYQSYGEYGDNAGLVLDHGSPKYMPLFFYHNTVIFADAVYRRYYAGGLGQRGLAGTHQGRLPRRVFNNIFFHVNGLPGMQFFYGAGADWPETTALIADGNLHWGFREGPDYKGDFLADGRRPQSRQPDWFARSQAVYDPGWTAHDVFADPAFRSFTPSWREADDLRLSSNSPAVDAGVPIPGDWPDPLRETDDAVPDIGAFPCGADPWRIGIRGRLTVFGERVGG